MKIDISKGHFKGFGARIEGRHAVFTFEVQTDSMPYIHLYQKEDKKGMRGGHVMDNHRILSRFSYSVR